MNVNKLIVPYISLDLPSDIILTYVYFFLKKKIWVKRIFLEQNR